LVGGDENTELMLNDLPPIDVSYTDIEGFVRKVCVRHERDSHDAKKFFEIGQRNAPNRNLALGEPN
jgi:hypothetical protein